MSSLEGVPSSGPKTCAFSHAISHQHVMRHDVCTKIEQNEEEQHRPRRSSCISITGTVVASSPRDGLNDGSGAQNILSQGTFQVALWSSGGKLYVLLFPSFFVLLWNHRAEKQPCKAGGFRRKCARQPLPSTNAAQRLAPGPHPKPRGHQRRGGPPTKAHSGPPAKEPRGKHGSRESKPAPPLAVKHWVRTSEHTSPFTFQQ